MKTKIQRLGNTPEEFIALHGYAATHLIALFRMFGMIGVSADWRPVGPSGVLGVGFTPSPHDPPGAFNAMRPAYARWIAEGMHMFGMTEIETEPSDTEYAELKQAWSTAMGQESSDDAPKLPPQVDPSHDNEPE